MFALLINTLSNAQYKIYKTKYDYRNYTYQLGDPYNPTIAGIASAIIPGLGQMVSGETGRGLAFLGGYYGVGLLFLLPTFSEFGKENDPGSEILSDGTKETLVTIGVLGMAGIWLWSLMDAPRVAKVNNLAWRDKNKSSLKLEIQPYFSNKDLSYNGKYSTGVTLKVRF